MRRQYPFHEIEPKWQKFWDEQDSFRAWNPGESVPESHPFASRHKDLLNTHNLPPKFYALDMFPYPSGSGLHVGHPEGYTATDIVSRYKRMRGFNVLHPMGWDAFGLPAEQFAVKNNLHPRVTTEKNVHTFKGQLKKLGFSYDWSREINTTDPAYYKWTQWIFLKLYNSWFDSSSNKARPIEELPIPNQMTDASDIQKFRDDHRLAYVSEAPVNWCPALGTVLANEEIIEGKSEVGGHPVERRPMRQWMLRITAYADRLIHDLDHVNWPEGIKMLQKNWIGRSEGAEVDFKIVGSDKIITVFTTRPDTLFGATYMVLAPEHGILRDISPTAYDATVPLNWKGQESTPQLSVAAYQKAAAKKSDQDRQLGKVKSGVFTGAYAVNPVNNAQIPIWIADYVLSGYGTGAIMAVPAHDERDLQFAQTFDLPIIQVVEPPAGQESIGFIGYGTAVNSGFIDGLPTGDAKIKMIDWLENKSVGRRMINFKLRDWLFSRQRYWGEPFPIIWMNERHFGLDDADLPLIPPDLVDYKPTGTPEPPLSKAGDWVNIKFTNPYTREVGEARRELNTMPQWAGSCWYYLRFTDASNSKNFVGSEVERYWMNSSSPDQSKVKGVDLYVGGTEHAVLHLLYARFWHKVLFDYGLVSTPEPFYRLVNQGLILGETELHVFEGANGKAISLTQLRDIDEEATPEGLRLFAFEKASGAKVIGRRLAAEDVEKKGEHFVLKVDPSIAVDGRSFKMSKSRGNVINPDSVVEEFGADALRLFEMFMGPLEQVKPWNTKGVEGVYRFLGRAWRLIMEEKQDGSWDVSAKVQNVPADPRILKILHETIRKVSEDIENLAFNTAISQMMIFVNEMTATEVKSVEVLKTFVQLLNPFAPHLTEELWEILNKVEGTHVAVLVYAPWPSYDAALLVEFEVEIVLQVNGKLRDKMKVPVDLSSAEMERLALANPRVAEMLAGRTPKKVIVVPNKLVNIVG